MKKILFFLMMPLICRNAYGLHIDLVINKSQSKATFSFVSLGRQTEDFLSIDKNSSQKTNFDLPLSDITIKDSIKKSSEYLHIDFFEKSREFWVVATQKSVVYQYAKYKNQNQPLVREAAIYKKKSLPCLCLIIYEKRLEIILYEE